MTIIRDRAVITNSRMLVRLAWRCRFLFIERARVGQDVTSFYRIAWR